MEKEHKFFERVVRSDIPSLEKFVLELNDDLHDGLFPDITKEEVIAKKEIVGDAIGTSFAHKYNIFQFLNSDIRRLHQAIRDMTIEACDYYGVDFNKQEYMLQGWFNCDNKSLDNLNDLHDHCGGVGLPFFHGYYCVNAEPSVTHYQLDPKNNPEEIFENVNVNDRAILSVVGKPHRKGKWEQDSKRITIAYDMIPLSALGDNNDKNYLQHWVPLI